ncbi:MAG: hypothetical protein IPP22_09395 [Nitrosomonas sp.]|nr:hypothetical protein [Nitrosomonas sp.]
MMLLDGQIVCDKFEKYPLFKKLLGKVLVFRAQYFYDGLRVGGVSSAIVCRKEYSAP